MIYYRPKKRATDYNYGRTHYSNPYFKPQRTVESRRHFVYNLLIMGIALGSWCYFLIFSGYFKITDWEIYGLKEYNKGEIETSLKNLLAQKKIAILPFENIFVLNDKDLNKQMSSQFAILEVQIKKYYPNKIILNFQEKSRKVPVYSGDKIYILTNDGTIAAIKEGTSNWYTTIQQEASTSTTTSVDLIKVITDAQNKILPAYPIFCDAYSNKQDLKVGGVYPIQKTIKLASDFIDNIKSKTKLDVKSASIINNKLGPKIIINTTNNWTVYLNSDDDGLKQFYKLYLVLNNELKDFNRPVEYIDLRFGDRVYIK